MTAPPTAFRWRWVAAGAAGALAIAIAVATRRAPGAGMIDYPWIDGVLRAGAAVRVALLATGSVAVAVAVVAAARRRALLEVTAGTIAILWLGGIMVAWTLLEERETASDLHELAGIQEVASAQIASGIRAQVSATELLAALNERDFTASAARTGAMFAGTVASALADERGNPTAVVPEAERARLSTALRALPEIPASGESRIQPIGAGSDGSVREGTLLLIAARSARGGFAASLIEPRALLAPAASADRQRVRIELSVSPAMGSRAPEPPTDPNGGDRGSGTPSASTVAGGLEWRVAAVPSREWLDARHHRGNTAVLALGVLGATCIVAGARIARQASATGARIATLEAQIVRLTGRLRIASLARDSVAQEASHVIRARLRETVRALDAASEPMAGPDARADALRRLGISLAQAEAEVAALLDSPAGTRIARAERDAELEHHYSHTVLEFAGGPSVDVSKPIADGALAALQQQLGSRTFAVITSDNPMSMPLPAQANMLRRGVLAHELRTARLPHLPVTGRDAEGTWSEHGFAIAATPAEAEALAEAHEQRAYFWFDGTAFVLQEAVGARRAIVLPMGAANRIP
jgi:hypothetical protein